MRHLLATGVLAAGLSVTPSAQAATFAGQCCDSATGVCEGAEIILRPRQARGAIFVPGRVYTFRYRRSTTQLTIWLDGLRSVLTLDRGVLSGDVYLQGGTYTTCACTHL